MNKRERVLGLLDKGTTQKSIPAAFFIHFDPKFHRGDAAVQKHLEYFEYTDMDVLKVQYENVFPTLPEITNPQDWEKIPCYGKEFYEEQLYVVEQLVKSSKRDAVVMATLYSPFMCAVHTSKRFTPHLLENPEAARKGLEIISESLMTFVKECIKLGVDGFYHSTEGGGRNNYDDISVFIENIKPYDLVLMKEIEKNCEFNVLHVCDYQDIYVDYEPYLDYPGHVISCGLELDKGGMSGKDVSALFNRPFMGGLLRKGAILNGTEQEIIDDVRRACDARPDKFMLAADCTVPAEVNWDNLKTAVSAAHEYQIS
ncbi:uroporphyrinogen decarboxylase family protein [Ruegeria atlantica]|uniref:uroporphyrinogen decarboxylase family protein n=1 Tax=Ruegeria atlantica TaxID=81569 RepID=UPI00147CECB9|nr:uroporphyrinogen decarboxylase family protein [Ruegeria atlantica]